MDLHKAVVLEAVTGWARDYGWRTMDKEVLPVPTTVAECNGLMAVDAKSPCTRPLDGSWSGRTMRVLLVRIAIMSRHGRYCGPGRAKRSSSQVRMSKEDPSTSTVRTWHGGDSHCSLGHCGGDDGGGAAAVGRRSPRAARCGHQEAKDPSIFHLTLEGTDRRLVIGLQRGLQ